MLHCPKLGAPTLRYSNVRVTSMLHEIVVIYIYIYILYIHLELDQKPIATVQLIPLQ